MVAHIQAETAEGDQRSSSWTRSSCVGQPDGERECVVLTRLAIVHQHPFCVVSVWLAVVDGPCAASGVTIERSIRHLRIRSRRRRARGVTIADGRQELIHMEGVLELLGARAAPERL